MQTKDKFHLALFYHHRQKKNKHKQAGLALYFESHKPPNIPSLKSIFQKHTFIFKSQHPDTNTGGC